MKQQSKSNSKKPLIERLAGFLEPLSYDTTYLSHGIHSYPAKYIPQLPRTIILEHTNERNTVLDPFCGSGTTLLEACILGRKSIGVDSNPIAVLISKAKTRILSNLEIEAARGILSEVRSILHLSSLPSCPVPKIPRIEHWFQSNVIRELAWLKRLVNGVESEYLRNFLRCIFSSIIVSVSNQESETRYASVSKNITDGYTMKRFANKLKQELENMEMLSANKSAIKNTPIVYSLDARRLDKVLAENSIDLVVTSPPYPNSYDYYLYHKMRMYWLGYNVEEVKNIEIGSRNEHSSRKAPINAYEEKIAPVMRNIARALKPSKLAYFFVGDAIIANKLVDMKEVFCRIAQDVNLKLVADAQYSLAKVSRSFHEKRLSANQNKYMKYQRILVFERTQVKKHVIIYRRMASPKPIRESVNLNGKVPTDGAVISIQSDDANRHIHALGKFPSKFIPDIPRWAISLFSKAGNLVLDPFVGSGTTAIEALILSRNSIASDYSPYACLLTEAKTTRASENEIRKYSSKLANALESTSNFSYRRRLEFEYDDFWFNTKHLEQIESLRCFITETAPAILQKFFLTVLSTVIKPCSYLDESQIKVKRDPKKVLSGTESPIVILKRNLPKYVERLIQFSKIADHRSAISVLQTSAETLYPTYIADNSVDLIVTSPPYINAMNYPMTHRYENLLLQLVPPDDNLLHQTRYFGTERVYACDYSQLHTLHHNLSCADELNTKLQEIYEREPKRSFIVYNYFTNMNEAFTKIVKTLKPRGYFILVAGSNVIRNIQIDTFSILVSFLEDLGLRRQSSFHYEIIKNAFKLGRHNTANIIQLDGVAIMEKPV